MASIVTEETDPEVKENVLNTLGEADPPATLSEEEERAALLLSLSAGVGGVEQAGKLVEALETINFDQPLGGNMVANALGTIGNVFGVVGGNDGEDSGGASVTTGQETAMSRFRKASIIGGSRSIYDIYEPSGFSSSSSEVATVSRRQNRNHAIPFPGKNYVSVCATWFCDEPGIFCVSQGKSLDVDFICCDSGHDRCNDPPCWHQGYDCPQQDSSFAMKSSKNRRRQLQDDHRRKIKKSNENGSDVGLDEHDFHHTFSDLLAGGHDHNSIVGDSRRAEDDHWFDGVNSQLANLSSEYMSLGGDEKGRRLQGRSGQYTTSVESSTMTSNELLFHMHQIERDKYGDAIKMVQTLQAEQYSQWQSAASEALRLAQLNPDLAMQQRIEMQDKMISALQEKVLAQQAKSQLMSRLTIMRDKIAKSIIVNDLGNNQMYPKISTAAFDMWVGRTTNLSNVMPTFEFPLVYSVPPDTPPAPTRDDPRHSYSFEYIEYKNNPYAWATQSLDVGGAPPSPEVEVITLIPFTGAAEMLSVKNEPEPIRVFADRDVFASARCMFWDRFWPDTAGGAWSDRGLLNDGRGCLTTHLSDVGIFIDGLVPHPQVNDAAKTFSISEIVIRTNVVVIASLGFVLLINGMGVVWGYLKDEKYRQDIRMGKIKKQGYHFDGDGVTKPLSFSDPIAYAWTSNPNMFYSVTFWNVIKREHIVVAALFYHPNFSRPQRIMCFGALVMGLMAFNAVIYGQQSGMRGASGDDPEEWAERGLSLSPIIPWGICGILGSLFIFPIVWMFMLMFASRPTQVKRRLVKRTYNPEKRNELKTDIRELERAGNLSFAFPQFKLPAHFGAADAQKSVLGLPVPPPPALAPPMMHAGGFFASGVSSPGAAMALTNSPSTRAPPPTTIPPPQVGGSDFLPPPPPAPTDGVNPLLPPIFFGKTAAPGALALPSDPNHTPPRARPTLTGPFEPGSNPGSAPATPRDMSMTDPHPLSVMDTEGATADPPTFNQQQNHSMPPPLDTAAMEQEDSPEEEIESPRFGLSTPPEPPAAPKPQPPAPPMNNHLAASSLHSSPAGSPRRAQGTPPLPLPPLAIGGHGPPTAAPPKDTSGIATPTRTLTAAPGQVDESLSLVPLGHTPAGLKGKSPYSPAFPPPPPRAGVTAMSPSVKSPVGIAAFQAHTGGQVQANLPMQQQLRHPTMPPPPKEEDEAFVRRVKAVYRDKVLQESQKKELSEWITPTGRVLPMWVYSATTAIPFVSVSSFVFMCIFMVYNYGLRFGLEQESNWYKALVVGISVSTFVFDVVRIGIKTFVELRKFEIRKLARQGFFAVRRIDKKETIDERQPRRDKEPITPRPRRAPKFRPVKNQKTPEPPSPPRSPRAGLANDFEPPKLNLNFLKKNFG